MNWDQVKGNWKEIKGMFKEKWGQISDDEFTKWDGKREQLAGMIQKKYGCAKDEAERQLKEFETSCKC